MAERGAKKQRLRELRDAHDCVRTIVNHMGKHYKTVKPPPWLDLRVVAGQMMRSVRTSSKHAAWVSLRESLTSVQTWMGDHPSWSDAVQVSKMPHIGTASEIKATEFIHGKRACIPECLMRPLRQMQMDFLLDPQPRSQDEVPDFWKGAELNDPHWRHEYMKRVYPHTAPFDDDLTDLVLSTVCQRGEPEKAEDEDEDEEGAEDEEEGGGDEKAAEDEEGDEEGDEISGKRHRREEKAQLEVHKKRQKTGKEAPRRKESVGEVPRPQDVIDTVENSDDDRPAVSYTVKTSVAKDDERLRTLKVGYKRLKRQNQQLVALYSNLENSNKKLGDDIELLIGQHKDSRKETSAGRQKHQQLGEKYKILEAKNRTLEEKTQQLTVQCAALTGDVRKLEDKSGQMAAQSSALEDENKIIRAQTVGLMARVEALEQAQSAPKPETGPPENTNAPEPAQYHYKRLRSRFPRVLDMPTFATDWDPQEEVLSRHHVRTYPSRLPLYIDALNEANGLATSHQYTNSRVRTPTPVPSQAQIPASNQAPGSVPILAQTQPPTPVLALTNSIFTAHPEVLSTTDFLPFSEMQPHPQSQEAHPDAPKQQHIQPLPNL
ncbi:hypothetical protein C8A00DRAFT_37560 [Chaetomidium leptoderma]|uniref:Uncharacterized protein n=1 Tax=Chaetomidium leptoderma TaxID=669021 RepID=A0AAN6VEF3_9PEZI|nr:hypothetical protein C8A00DRAFT_37560 [Chaetomidium leptoderma]